MMFNNSQMQVLEMLAKLCQAYPAYSTVMMPQKPAQGQIQQTKKPNFFQWYMKEFLVFEVLGKLTNSIPDSDQVEVYYQIKPTESVKLLEGHIFRFLNRLTSYNHMMTLNEQLIKHELRSKLMLEALSILQKIVKDKSSKQGSLTSRALLIVSLSVIEALINSQSPNAKTLHLSGSDNFLNSLRVCFLRDWSSKSDLPAPLLKLLDDLLTECIDVSLPQNADIVTKCVTLLKVVSEFVSQERKKEEVKEEEAKVLVIENPLANIPEQIVHPELDESDEQIDVQALSQSEEDEESDEDHVIEDDHEEEDDDDGDDNADDEDEDEDEDMHQIVDEYGGEEDADEYGGEELDDDDDADELDGGIVIRDRRQHAGGPQMDIINVHQNEPHGAGIYRYIPMGGDRRQNRVPAGVDWSQEEADVQRILGNLRGTELAAAAAPNRVDRWGALERDLGMDFLLHHRQHRDGGGNAAAAPGGDQELSKTGIIDYTFEDLKIMGDDEIYKIVSSQQSSIERELQNLNNKQQPKQESGEKAKLPLPAHNSLFERIQFIQRPRVDELDDEDFPDFMRMAPPFMADMLQGGEDDFLNRMLMDQALMQPGGLFNFGNRYQDFANNNRRGAEVRNELNFQSGEGLFLTQLRQQQQHALNMGVNNQIDSLSQQLLSAANVQVEEEKKEEQPRQQHPPATSARAAQQNQRNNAFQVPPMPFALYDQFLDPTDRVGGNQANPADLDLLSSFFNVMQPLGEPNQPAQEPVIPAQNVEAASEVVEQQLVNPSSQPQQQQVEQDNVNEGVAHITEQFQQVQIPSSSEEVKRQEEQKEPLAQPAEQQQQPPADSDQGKTCGYDNLLLIANGIDPEVLQDLPEELRAELLSSIDFSLMPQPEPAQQQQQPPAQQQNSPRLHVEEEKKQEQPVVQAQQPQPGQQPPANQPAYYALAQELGLDPEFLANIPESMRNELIQQAQQERNPVPQRQAEEMDLATLLATVTDVSLRREIFMNMNEATIAGLPAPLMAEARRIHEYINNDRARIRQAARGIIDPMMGGGHHAHLDDGAGGLGMGMFGNARRRAREEIEQREREMRQQAEKSLEEIVNYREKQLNGEAPKDDIINAMNNQLIQDEKIIEAFIMILLTNEKIQCDLIPCMQFLLKIQNSSGIPVIRNKIVNAITFILKCLATNDDASIKELLPKQELKKKNAILLMIGTLRLLLKANKSLMKYILKGLISKEDLSGRGNQVLKKQMKAILIKQPQLIDQLDEPGEQAKISKSKNSYQAPSPLLEIFSLIKTEFFKGDKMLMRNLTLLIHQILKQFDIAKQELEQSQQQISQDTISTIAEVLSLENIDQHMMDDLGDFFFKISLQKKQNFQLISTYCSDRTSLLLEKLTQKLLEFSSVFETIREKSEPSRRLQLESRQLSQISNEEEKHGEMMINTSSNALALTHTQSLGPNASNTSAIKNFRLTEDEEKLLKQNLKVHEDSEILYRLFKLYNLFYDKFSKEAEKKEAVEASKANPNEVVEFVKAAYENETIKLFINTISETLKIVLRVNMDTNEGVSNLIFCVLSSFYPELFDSIRFEEEQKKQDKKEAESKKDKAKFQIKFMTLEEAGGSSGAQSKERVTLFRNTYYITNRIEELSQFCLINKRIINKMIKSKPNLFVNELEGLIRHMPNLLDFDNKRTYFKKELNKLKRNSMFGNDIQLYIRRDDIFQDSFTQIRDRSANEMKGRLHISFTGERGQDAGGLTRDFFIELSREMFNPNYSLFILSSSGSTYYPNPKSHVEVDHLRYFKFIGRMIGKALFDECLLECYFVKSLYKIMTGEPLKFSDLEDYDNEFYNNMKWCLENDVDCLMTTFVAESDYFGKPIEIELKENGKNIPVTNENKREYVEKLCFFKLYTEIQKQVDNFLEGFYELIPKDLVSVFNYKELELLISGLPNFDLDDLKANTEFQGYNAQSVQVLWLWEVLEQFDNSERAEFLQFVTGSSKVPLDGFKGLIGMRGPQKFTIAKIKTDDFMRLPSGHTCFNQIDLPEYPSKEILHERLLLAIKETKGFGFA